MNKLYTLPISEYRKYISKGIRIYVTKEVKSVAECGLYLILIDFR